MPPKGPLSVSELSRRLRGNLEAEFRAVWVAGEISNLKLPRSGHAYFTLKDEHAQLRCVMWADALERLRFSMRDGQQVAARGKLTLYAGSGDVQVQVAFLEPLGLGALQQEFQELLEKLRQEGLTATEKKRPLPRFPRVIGVVSSASGAALRDILITLLRRDPTLRILISPAQVQGRPAAASISGALTRLERLGLAELIILARGGGSLEDLWAFNEEVVARTIVRMRVPVITGVGHETDTTIADYVADVRASTPTAAAELSVPVRSKVLEIWQGLQDRLAPALSRNVDRHTRRLMVLERRLGDPSSRVQRFAQDLDSLEARAERLLRRQLGLEHQRLQRLEAQLAAHAPASRLLRWARQLGTTEERLHHLGQRPVARARVELQQLEQKLYPLLLQHLQKQQLQLQRLEARLDAPVQRQRAAAQHGLGTLVARLDALSPLTVLARGYAVVSREGLALKDARAVQVGDQLRVRLGHGALRATVTEVEPTGS